MSLSIRKVGIYYPLLYANNQPKNCIISPINKKPILPFDFADRFRRRVKGCPIHVQQRK